MSEIWPESSSDERDPRDDENEKAQREAEIKSDKPPHHD